MKPLMPWAVYAILLILPARGTAHYHILLPDKASCEREVPVRFSYHFGHPYEHQLFPVTRPASITVVAPDGTATDLGTKVEPINPGAGGSSQGYSWTVTPTRRGDHVIFVRCEPVWMEEEKEYLDDSVKVVLHVQTQKGWDQPAISLPAADSLELIPLTRPYGLRPGTVFQVQVRGRSPLPGALVEVERYNAEPPKDLPPDEHITRTMKTDPNGVATVTLPEAGWWAITAVRDGGTRTRQGKTYPVKIRSTFWVPVDK